MAEGLAAVSLAGNIIQFITFSTELVSKTKDIHQSGSGVPSELLDLDNVSQSLKIAISRILIDNDTSPQLREVAKRCNEVSIELLEATEHLRHHSKSSGKGPTRLQSFRKALKHIWNKEQIDALKTRLHLLRDQLSLHLLSDTNQDQAHLHHLLKTWKTQNLHTTHTITSQLRDLDAKLRKIQKNAACIFDEKDREKLEEDRKKLYDSCAKVQCDVRLFAQNTVIYSLQYECMENRNEAITEAHGRTFDWMFAHSQSQEVTCRPTSTFTQWLQTGTGIYWVTGKPGSGKSTLMKYLFHNSQLTEHLRIWAGSTRLVQASFYFWIPGQEMQKSMKGLLQTLLYHILDSCPDLVSILCPERLKQQRPETFALRPWTLSELRKAFQIFRTCNAVDSSFYFHIDGLDEYCGDSWDVIQTLKDLAACSNVKMCLSSRPWNSFQDAFGQSNPFVLRLHEWTMNDIRLFASESLTACANQSDFEPCLFDNLIEDISERAQGVFLWVRLVVRSLRDGIVNDDPISLLHERLREIPVDLEEFFELILESVETVYRPRMARAFLVALKTQEPLRTIHYHFLDDEDATFELESLITPWSKHKIQLIVDQTHRRLNGRYRGLLEPSEQYYTTKHPTVDFLHRTLRDFLKTERMMKKLNTRASAVSNVHFAMGRALLAAHNVIHSDFVSHDPDTLKNVIELSSLATRDIGDAQKGHGLVDLAHDMYQRAGRDRFHSECGINCYIVHFALNVGHVDYMRHCIQRAEKKLDVNHILKHALCCPLKPEQTFSTYLPDTHSACALNVLQNHERMQYPTKHFGHDLSADMISTLLALGANPNAVIGPCSAWTLALGEAVAQMDGPRSESLLEILAVFLQGHDQLDSSLFTWDSMLSRSGSTTSEGLRNTLRYLELFFSNRLDPNLVSQGTTLFSKFMQTLPNTTNRLFIGDNTAIKLQHEILLVFLRAGADITQVYKDEAAASWFPSFLRELSRPFLDETKIIEFRLLLENGLDLNAVMRGNITVWYRLLGEIYRSLQANLDKIAHQRAIHRVMLLSLQYGADPCAPGIPRIVQWMKSRSCHLAAKAVADIESALPPSVLLAARAFTAGGKRKGDHSRLSNEMSQKKRGKNDNQD